MRIQIAVGLRGRRTEEVLLGRAILLNGIRKYNPNHDEKGQFSSSDSSAEGPSPELAHEISSVETTGEHKISGSLFDNKVAALYKEEGYYQSVNAQLRTGETAWADNKEGREFDDRAHEIIQHLDALMAKSEVTEGFTTYRNFGEFNILDLRRGDVIEDKAFVSTSLSKGLVSEASSWYKPDLEGGSIAKIEVPKGSKALRAFRGDAEVILNRGSRFVVTRAAIQQQQGDRLVVSPVHMRLLEENK